MSGHHNEDDRIGPLLRLAGPREPVPADRMRRVKTAVRAEWRQQTRARVRRITIGRSLGAIAAAALVLIGVRLAIREDAAAPIPRHDLARIETISGTAHPISSSKRGTERASFQIGDRLQEGDGIETPTGGRAALRLAGGNSVRLDHETRLRLLSDTSMVLEKGAIYVDSGDSRGARSLEIQTRLGVVRDIGTRFEVRLSGTALRVRVRDGVVLLSQRRRSDEARPGDELTLDDRGSILRQTIPVYGTDWAWAVALARPFDLEGRSLRDFLDWIAGEHGWQLRFEDAAVEEKSRTTILHGSIQGLTPEEALSAVLPASGVGHQLENGVLQVRLGTGDAKD